MKQLITRGVGLSPAYFEKRHITAEPKPSPDSFFFRAFAANEDTAQKVLDTNYLQKMKDGILEPDRYGQLTVLDAYYCYRGANSYDTALCQVDPDLDAELHQLMSALAESYHEYNMTFFNDWHIRTAESVNPTAEFEAYAEHEHHVSCAEQPVYTLVAMLPCYYLWYWFTDKMLPEVADDNLYKGWVEGSHSCSTAYRIGNFIESWKQMGKEFDEQLAMEIYTKSMNCELSVFSKA